MRMKRPFFGIRPPGAPTSIRPPRSAHGSGSSLFRRPGRAMPHPSRTTPTSEPPLVEPVPAPEPLRRPTRRPAPAEPSPAREPRHRPTSRPAPSEPPPARKPPQRPDHASHARGKPRDFDWGPAILTASVALIVVGLVLVGSLDNDGERNAARRARPTRATSAPRFSASSRATTPTSSNTADDSWKQAWSIDLELDDDADIRTYVSGDHLVVHDRAAGAKQQLRGYSLAGGRPQELWSITPRGRPQAMTPTVLVSSRSLIDPATGEATDAPWGSSEPVLVTDDFIITCTSRPSPACTGWDLADKTLTQRWGPVAFPGTVQPGFLDSAVTGDTHTGYALAMTGDSDSSKERGTVSFVSLADGSIMATRPQKEAGKVISLFPAADGRILLKDDEKPVTALGPDGTEQETYTASQSTSALLLTDSGIPTLDQYKKAFTSGDISWASIALSCRSQEGTCTLNGRTVTDADYGTKSSPMYKQGFTATVSERYLILNHSRSGHVRIIDRDRGGLVPRRYGPRDHVAVARADLLIAVKDSSLVGYAPAG